MLRNILMNLLWPYKKEQLNICTDTIWTTLLFPYVFQPNAIVVDVLGHVCVMSKLVYRYVLCLECLLSQHVYQWIRWVLTKCQSFVLMLEFDPRSVDKQVFFCVCVDCQPYPHHSAGPGEELRGAGTGCWEGSRWPPGQLRPARASGPCP